MKISVWNILQHIIEDIRASRLKISIQLDESIDVDQCSQLTYVRYIKKNCILEDLLFCEPLKLTTKCIDVYHHIKNFFLKLKTPISVIGSISTPPPSAPALVTNNSGFIAYIKKKLPLVITT